VVLTSSDAASLLLNCNAAVGCLWTGAGSSTISESDEHRSMISVTGIISFYCSKSKPGNLSLW
jgi:hypothetical protein